MATIRKVGGEHDLYHIHFLDGQAHPDHGLPGHGHPDQGLPGGGHHPVDPGYGRPGGGPHPGNRPPGSGGGGIPDNELPSQPPPQVAPGMTLVLVRHDGKWVYAAIAPGSPPPRPLPPGEIEHPGNRPPGSSPGHPSGQPVPPTPTPTGPR
jgi:hypothetical protein